MRLEARGSRNLGSGEEPINDSETRSQLKNKARTIQIAALVAGSVLTALAYVITG